MPLCGVCGDEAPDDGWLNELRNFLLQQGYTSFVKQAAFNYQSNTMLTINMIFSGKLICTPAGYHTFGAAHKQELGCPLVILLPDAELVQFIFSSFFMIPPSAEDFILKICSFCLCCSICGPICPRSCIYSPTPHSIVLFAPPCLTPPLVLSARIQSSFN